MSHSKKLEQVLEFLINEEVDQATDLLHQIVVEKARDIYSEIVNESDFDGIDMDEDFGGDAKDDFVDDIKQDKTDIENDEVYDETEVEDEVSDEVEDEEASEDLDDRVLDLETQLEELRAEFEALVNIEEEEPEHDDLAGQIEDEVDTEEDADEFSMESLEEATKLQDEVTVDMKKEGKHAGTGKNSKDASVGNTNSLHTASTTKVATGGKPTDFSSPKGNSMGNQTAQTKKDNGFGAGDNVDVKNKEVKKPAEGEGKFAGTGKNSSSSAVNKNTLFTKKIS